MTSRSLLSLLLAMCLSAAAAAQVAPVKPGELSFTHLLKVERVVSAGPDEAPDGLRFYFLVSRTPVARHKFALKETRDFNVLGHSYREATRTALGQVFEPRTEVHNAAKYLLDRPELGPTTNPPPGSLILVVTIQGAPLDEGQPVEVTLHAGFGRTTDAPEGEDLIFRTEVPVP